jgi:hypothetical protein
MQVKPIRWPEVGEDGDLSRTAVGPRNVAPSSRPDRRRGAPPRPGRRPGRPPAPVRRRHRPWPGDQRRPRVDVRPAPRRPRLDVGLSGGEAWPLTSSPGPTSSGPFTPVRGRSHTSPGRLRSGRPSPGPAPATATRAGLDPVYLRSGGRTTSPLCSCTSGADSPAQPAGESAPSVSGWANLTVRTPLRSVDRSIQPGCLSTAPGSVAGQVGGRR